MGRRLNKKLIRLFSVFLVASILFILPVIFTGCPNPLQDVAKGMVFSEINLKYETEDIPSGSEYDFGNVPIESTKSANFTIENLGTADLILFGDSPFIEITGKNASEFSVETPPKSPIAPGSSSTFIISFNPTTADTKTATIVIKNYDADENPYTIETIGNGVDGPPPPTVTVFPSSPTNDNTPTWSWSEVTGATKYRYSFTDGSNWKEHTDTVNRSYTPSSPLEEDGIYTLYVQAYDDSLGVWSSSGSASVTIDTLPPTATLMNTPSNPTASQTIDITVGGIGVVAYKYQLDSGLWSSELDISIHTHITDSNLLSLGFHNVYVIGKDAAGNWQTASTDYNWEIIEGPPPPTVTVFPNSPTNDNTPTWSWSEVSVATKYQYSFTDGSNWTEHTDTVNRSYTPSSPLADGTYTLYVQAYDDSVDVWSASGSAIVTVDSVPPTAVLINTPSNPTASRSIDITVGGTGVVAYKYKLDSGLWSSERDISIHITDSSLSLGFYNVYVVGKDAAGNWQTTSTYYSWEIKVVPPPPTVTVFPNSPTNDNTPTWSWSEVSVATKYQYSFTDGSNWTEHTDTVNRSYTPSSPLADGTYTLYVQAYDKSLDIWSASGSASVTIDTAPPTGVSATDGTHTDKIRITWNSVSYATRYYVYRSTSSSGTYSSLGYVTGLYKDDTTVTSGTTYYYKIKAYNDGHYSDLSSYNSGWRKLLPPTGVSASDGTYTDKVRVSWSSVSGASQYYVYRATSSSGTYSSIGNTTSTYYYDTSAIPGTTYYYKLKAYNGGHYSDLSGYNSGWRKLLPPTGVSASDGTYTDKVRVGWSSASGASRYYVYRATSSSGTYSSIGNTTSTYYYDTSAIPGTTYYYKLKAYNGGHYSDLSGYNSGWRKLLPPTGVSATDGTYTDKIRITWNSVSGATRYYVYRSTSSSGTYSSLGYVTGLYMDDTSIPEDTSEPSYYYKVRAYNNGRYSAYSGYNSGKADQYSRVMVTFTFIRASNKGDELDNTLELYWNFSTYGGAIISERTRNNAMSVTVDNAYKPINEYNAPFDISNINAVSFGISCSMKESDPLFDDDLGYFTIWYVYNTSTRNWVRTDGSTSSSQVLTSADGASVTIYWNIQRTD